MGLDLKHIAGRLSAVHGVKAVALGGSRSRDEAGASSDYDIGLYYDGNTIDVAGLRQIMRELDDGHRDGLLNGPGTWGPWIDGGGWLIIDGTPVDVLLREAGRVGKVIDDCLLGVVTIDYQCGHPFGFVNTIYAAETHFCVPLYEAAGAPLDALKKRLYSEGDYPPKMKEALVRKFLWEARFSLDCGKKPALRSDLNYAAGSAFRTVCAWLEVLYALSEVYLMNEKGALTQLGKLKYQPPNMEARVREAYQSLASGSALSALDILEQLHGEVEALSAE